MERKKIKSEYLYNASNSKNQFLNIINSERDKKNKFKTILFNKPNIFENAKTEKLEKKRY